MYTWVGRVPVGQELYNLPRLVLKTRHLAVAGISLLDTHNPYAIAHCIIISPPPPFNINL